MQRVNMMNKTDDTFSAPFSTMLHIFALINLLMEGGEGVQVVKMDTRILFGENYTEANTDCCTSTVDMEELIEELYRSLSPDQQALLRKAYPNVFSWF